MTQEEKAKRYDDLLVKLQEAKVDNNVCDDRYCCVIDDIVPELKESEDERVRKELIEFVKSRGGFKQEYIAWLEKQYKQKHPDKVEAKFKIGDWLVHKDLVGVTCCITQIHAPHYYLTNKNSFIKFGEEDNYRPWTIQDAKDGDVLYMDNGLSTCTFIYKSIDNVIIQKYASYNKFGFEGTTYLVLNDGYVCPATKEQRDLLFQKMKEAGYEWNAEKKELKKSESYSLRSIIKDEPSPAIKKVVDSLTAWSEEDDRMLDKCIKAACSNYYPGISSVRDWLKSLKDRVQPKQEWSEKDKEIIETICKEGDLKPSERVWLKSLRPQSTWKPSDLPHWKKSTLPDNTTGFNSDYFCYKGYNINYKELFEKLPKDN